jgi:hypothetical protein
MIIDCDQCALQDTAACRECVVGSLLHHLAGPIEVDADQAEALEILAEHDLVPELRLIPRATPGEPYPGQYGRAAASGQP